MLKISLIGLFVLSILLTEATSQAQTTPTPAADAPVEAVDAEKARQTSVETVASEDKSESGQSDAHPAEITSATEEESGNQPTRSVKATETTEETSPDEQQMMDKESPATETSEIQPPGSAEDNSTSNVVSDHKVNLKQAPTNSDKVLTEKQKEEEKKRHMFVVTYNMAQPRGKTSDFVNKFSFEGFGFEYRFFIQKQISIGLAFNWNTFELKESDVFSLDSNSSISGTRIKMTDLIQVAPTVQYHFKKQSAAAVPFIGFNVGPYYTSRIEDWGWWYSREASWQFGVSPEIGVRITKLPVPLYLAIRYSYAVKTNKMDSQQVIGFNLGIAFLK